jgi:hypothetical protein
VQARSLTARVRSGRRSENEALYDGRAQRARLNPRGRRATAGGMGEDRGAFNWILISIREQ